MVYKTLCFFLYNNNKNKSLTPTKKTNKKNKKEN